MPLAGMLSSTSSCIFAIVTMKVILIMQMSFKCFASYPINTQHSRSYGNIKSKMVSCATQSDHSMILAHLDTQYCSFHTSKNVVMIDYSPLYFISKHFRNDSVFPLLFELVFSVHILTSWILLLECPQLSYRKALKIWKGTDSCLWRIFSLNAVFTTLTPGIWLILDLHNNYTGLLAQNSQWN